MTSRTINYTITATSQIDQVMNQITGAVQNMGNVSAAQIPKLAKEIANAQAATSRAASAIEAYRQNLLKTDTAVAGQAAAQQRLVAAQNATTASAERVRREAIQTAAAEQALAAATLRTQAAWTSAASAATRYAEQTAKAGRVPAGGGEGPGGGAGGGAAALIGGVAGGVVALALGGIKAVGEAALDTGGKAVTLASDLELTKAAFTSMTGSAAVADRTLAAIRQYADDSIFEFPNLTKAVTSLEGVGLGSKSALAGIKDLGAEIQGRGKDAATLDRLALAQSQVISKQRLMGDEAQQFAEAGLPVWQILSSYLNTDAASAQKLSEQGRITADIWSKALHADALQNFANASEQAGKSWAAMSSTMNDAVSSRLADFGQGVMEGLKPALQDVITLLKDPGVAASIKEWGREVGGFFQQMEYGAKLIAGLFGLQMPALQKQKDDLGGVAEQWNTISVNMGDITTQVQGLKDSEDGIRAGAEATSRAYETRIARLRDAATALDRQYETETKIQQLHKLDADIEKNRLLGKNIFSSEGRAAAIKAEEQGEQRTQLLREMGHAAQKNALADSITALERQKQAAAQNAQDQIVAVERNIKGIQREAAAYDEYNRAKLDAIAKYRKTLEDADTNAGTGATVGVRGLGTEVGGTAGLLDQFSEKLRRLLGDSGLAGLFTLSNQVQDSLRTFGGIVGGLTEDVGKLGEALGVDKGLAAAFKGAEVAGRGLLGYLLSDMPKVAQSVGAGFAVIAHNVDVALKGITAGVAGLAALDPNATPEVKARFAASVVDFQGALTNVNKPTTAGGGTSIGSQAGGGEPPTRMADRRQRVEIEVTHGYDESTGLLRVMQSTIRNHPELIDAGLGAH